MRYSHWLIVGLALAVLLPGALFAEWQSVGPDGGYIQGLAIAPTDPDLLFCASYEYPDSARLFASEDHGASWQLRGTVPDASVTYLAADPFAPGRLYAGGRTSVVFRSTDAGESWTAAALPGYGMAMAADPFVEGRLFVSGYYRDGGTYRAAAYVSSDTGRTWQVSMPQPDTAGYAYSVAADPVDSGTFYIGAYAGKAYRTTDAGASWELVNSGLPSNTGVMGISVCAADNRCLLAATSNGLYRTTNSGTNWSLVGGGLMNSAQSVAFSDFDPSVGWAIGRSDSIRVYVSDDTGATWSLPAPGYVTNKTARLTPDGASGSTAWVHTTSGIFRSTDLGDNWAEAHAGLRIAHVACISASPEDPDRLYLEAEGNAVFRSLNGGEDWERCTEFLSCGNICGIGVGSATDRDVLYALEGSG